MTRGWGLAGSVAVTVGLLITAGLASRGHPLSRGGSLSGRATDILIVAAFCVAVALMVALAIESRRPVSTARRRFDIGDVVLALVLLAAVTVGAYGLGRLFHPASHPRAQHGIPCVKYEKAHGKPTSNCADAAAPAVAKTVRHAVQAGWGASWLAIGAIVVLLTGGTALFALERRSLAARPTEAEDDRRGTVAAALDLSIDDLRQEPDAGRAIVAAYARMETALMAIGLSRRAAEAPHEFLVRSLEELDASAEAAARLTELFELAKFSRHAATESMRDEAIEALISVRDELTTASS